MLCKVIADKMLKLIGGQIYQLRLYIPQTIWYPLVVVISWLLLFDNPASLLETFLYTNLLGTDFTVYYIWQLASSTDIWCKWSPYICGYVFTACR